HRGSTLHGRCCTSDLRPPSHTSADAGLIENFLQSFPVKLKEVFKARVTIAQKRLRGINTIDPTIHAVSAARENLPVTGPIHLQLAEKCAKSFIFIGLITENYLASEVCLTELHAFLHGPRDPILLRYSLFLAMANVERSTLFDLPEYLDSISRTGHIKFADDAQRTRMRSLSKAISDRIGTLYEFPENLQVEVVPEDADSASSYARDYAVKIARSLMDSRFLIDPIPATPAMLNQRAIPLVVIHGGVRIRGSTSATGDSGEQKAVECLEHLSEAEDVPPLRAYSVALDLLLDYGSASYVSPFDPALPKSPTAYVFIRNASIQFARPNEDIISQLSQDFKPLRLTLSRPVPDGWVLALADEAQEAIRLDPEPAAREFVEHARRTYIAQQAREARSS
ncbi:MAG TPA: hypothetical protein PK177_07795, partial [Burkholderiaceae bacterium]|nr:hypothetical protein [Burkholderiaceae bacterium]